MTQKRLVWPSKRRFKEADVKIFFTFLFVKKVRFYKQKERKIFQNFAHPRSPHEKDVEKGLTNVYIFYRYTLQRAFTEVHYG